MSSLVHSLFLWFYRLPIRQATGFMLLGICLFLALRYLFRSKRWWRPALLVGLCLWLGLVVYTTVGSRSVGTPLPCRTDLFHSYRELMNGGNPEILRSNFMNAALFVPAGLLADSLLPKRWPSLLRTALLLVFFLLFSVGIEFLQYRFVLGQAEADDVLHNTLGALAGAAAARIPVRQPPRTE